ncbi:hypothetical protein QQ045_004411 [Rhodiola kirilowii]
MECDETEVFIEDDTIPHEDTREEHTNATPTISLNALDGCSSFNCMRVIGQYGNRKLYILIDPGSTHNFLDLNVAKEIGCLLASVPPLAVAAANGNNMLSGFRCNDFSWKMQGYTFTTDIRTLPLNCCDMVLGVQWLITLEGDGDSRKERRRTGGKGPQPQRRTATKIKPASKPLPPPTGRSDRLKLRNQSGCRENSGRMKKERVCNNWDLVFLEKYL